MQPQHESPRRHGPWVLLLGPGERMGGLSALLRSLPPGEPGLRPGSIRVLEELGELFSDFPDAGRLVLDADRLPLADAGLVAAFLARRPAWRLALCGSDPGAGAARRLLGSPSARWIAWPLDVVQLDELARLEGAPAAEHAPSTQPRAEREPPSQPGERAGDHESLAPELRAEIERILGPAPPRPAEAGEERGSGTLRREARERPGAGAEELPQAPPLYFKDQVADLADAVQRVELAAARAREHALSGARPGSEALRGFEELDLELMRLAQFTRTLGYLAAPPAPGNQRVELAEMIEEMLSAAGREPDSPRYLLRTGGPLWVRADKALLAQALDALLYLAHHCAGPKGTVRVEGSTDPSARPPAVRFQVSFPPGPLDGTSAERALEPYALRRLLPELGPNALAAAAGILRGQGGSLELERPEAGLLRWKLALPAHDEARRSQV